jgi:hypothetical protein
VQKRTVAKSGGGGKTGKRKQRQGKTQRFRKQVKTKKGSLNLCD